MTVSAIVSRDKAARLTKSDNLYNATEWVIDEAGGTPLHLHRRLAPSLTRRLECIMASGEIQGVFFDDDQNLNVQATRGVRRLTPESAGLLDHIIAITDSLPKHGELLTVTAAMVDNASQGQGQPKTPRKRTARR